MKHKTTWRHWSFLALSATLALWPLAILAVTPENLAQELTTHFGTTSGKKKPSASLVQSRHFGMVTRVVVFAVGPRTYRVVFSSDGTVTVALKGATDIAAQPLWSSKVDKTSVGEIVNIISIREEAFLPQNMEGYEETQNRTDLETARGERKRAPFDMRWSQLMDRVTQGDTMGMKQGGDVSSAMSLAKSLDPCGTAQGQGSPQKDAVIAVAQALAAASMGKGTARRLADDQASDHSREFEAHGSESRLEELADYRKNVKPEEAFRLIRDSRGNSYALFRGSLRQAERENDPYALAAYRNFRRLRKEVGRKQGNQFVDQALKKVLVDIDAFLGLRNLSGDATVIYDRLSDRYFVDPTLNSPSQARYLLSIAAIYEWKLANRRTSALVQRYRKLGEKIQRLESAVIDKKDQQQLKAYRNKMADLARKLFEIGEDVRKTATYPW